MFPGAAVTRDHRWVVLNRDVFSPSSGGQKSEIEVSAVLPLKALGEDPALSLLLPMAPGIPWLVAASLQFLPLCFLF